MSVIASLSRSDWRAEYHRDRATREAGDQDAMHWSELAAPRPPPRVRLFYEASVSAHLAIAYYAGVRSTVGGLVDSQAPRNTARRRWDIRFRAMKELSSEHCRQRLTG